MAPNKNKLTNKAFKIMTTIPMTLEKKQEGKTL